MRSSARLSASRSWPTNGTGATPAATKGGGDARVATPHRVDAADVDPTVERPGHELLRGGVVTVDVGDLLDLATGVLDGQPVTERHPPLVLAEEGPVAQPRRGRHRASRW